MRVAVDNDILYKGAWYGFLRELVTAIPAAPDDAAVLGQARFVIGKRLQKQQKQLGEAASRALEHLEAALALLKVVEPTEEEQSLAAELEYLAQVGGVALDGGESLLCAVTIRRGLDRLATGDKRAIAALGALLGKHPELTALAGKIVCLEQLVLRLLGDGDSTVIRSSICAQKHTDKALANCFSCSNPDARPRDWLDGLTSYIRSVRSTAETLLCSDT